MLPHFLPRRAAWWALTFLFLTASLTLRAQTPAPDPGKWEADIAAFEAADRTTPFAPGGVLFAGSSTFRLWPDLPHDFPRTRLLNRAFGGATTPDVLAYFDRVIALHQPKLVVLYIGDNDLAAGRSPEQVAADVADLLTRIRRLSRRTRVLYAAIKPSPSRAQLLPQVRQANALIAADLHHRKRMRYVDVFTPMLDAQGQPRAELFGPDALHMNATGYALWTQLLRPLVDKWQ